MDQTGSHQVHHIKPKAKLPLLQNAIKENNSVAIEHLVNEVKYGIAFENDKKHVILSEDKNDLPIQLLYISHGVRTNISIKT